MNRIEKRKNKILRQLEILRSDRSRFLAGGQSEYVERIDQRIDQLDYELAILEENSQLAGGNNE